MMRQICSAISLRQPEQKGKNGFKALAVFDTEVAGGNENGLIDAGDAIVSRLRVWIDANHNGISEPDELHKLGDLGIKSISVAYHKTEEIDPFGNRFRYEAKIQYESPRPWKHSNTRAYDVFLRYEPEVLSTSLLDR